MSLETLGWALQITGVSPIAKLIAVFVLDGKQENAPQEFEVTGIAAFACCSIEEIEPGLDELEAVHAFKVEWRENGLVYVDRSFERPPESKFAPEDYLYIYVITAHGRSKIGISGDPTQRLKRMATALGLPAAPRPLLLVRGLARAIRRAEVAALASLAEFNTSGEWFAVDPERAIDAVKAALRAENIGDSG